MNYMEFKVLRDWPPPSIASSTLTRYVLAAVLSAVAAVVARLLAPHIAPYTTPPYIVAVMLASAYGGAGPGLFATAITTLFLAWFSPGSPSPFTLTGGDVAEVTVFLIAAIGVSSLAGARTTAQRRLQRALADLSEVDRAKDEFIAAVSHELRTPLTSILGWTEMLRRDIDADTRSVALRSIEESAMTQKMLVDDLLDASRIVMGKFEIHRRRIELEDVVDRAVEAIRPSLTHAGLTVTVKRDDAPIQVDGDPERLRQVLWNLLSNAHKFTSRGGTITIGTGRRLGMAFVEVTDSGDGIDRDLLPVLFDRFRQGPEGVRRGGLGLGLSISKSIVERHGGSITAESRGRGRGSTFRVTLPVASAETHATKRPGATASPIAEGIPRSMR